MKSLLSAVSAFSLVFLGGALLYAAEPPLNVQLNVPAFSLKATDPSQNMKPWAWVAICEMAIRYRYSDTDHKSCSIMEAGYKLQPGACCDNPAFVPSESLGLEDVGRVLGLFGCKTSVAQKPRDCAALAEILKKGNPVIVQLASANKASQMLIVRGVKIVTFTASQTVPTLSLVGGGGVTTTQRMVSVDSPIVLVNDPLGVYPTQIEFSELQRLWGVGLILE